jgi:hypothetical protein
MRIPTPIKVLAIMGIILYGCFETLQSFNRQYALESGKTFFKVHNAKVESIDCYIPASRAIDQSAKICTFNTTSDQFKMLIENLKYRLIKTNFSGEDEIEQFHTKVRQQFKSNKKIDPELKRVLNDSRNLPFLKRHACIKHVNLEKFSELKIYGTSEAEENKQVRDFFIFYNSASQTGCLCFENFM